MKEIEECDIVIDLLPSYVDEITTKSSNELIETHIKTCEKCKKNLEEMKQKIVTKQFPNKEINYLKKLNQKLNTRTVVLILISMLLIGVLGVMVLLPLLNPKKILSPLLLEQINLTWIAEDEQTNTIQFELTSSYPDKILKSFSLKEEGPNLYLQVYGEEVKQIGKKVERQATTGLSAEKTSTLWIKGINSNGIDKIFLQGKQEKDRKLVWQKNQTILPYEQWKTWFQETSPYKPYWQ